MTLPASSTSSHRPTRAALTGLLVIITLSVIAVALALWSSGFGRSVVHRTSSTAVHGEVNFPALPDNLSERQRTVLELARKEFEAQPPGVRFSQGEQQAWCANFVSWIMKEAGVPLKNPHTGSWRIPGIFTLKEYYQSVGRWRAVDSGYIPRPGDVAIYQRSPVFGDHTNIVISHTKNATATVGGNEINRVRVYVNSSQNDTGLLGWGILE